MKTYRSHPPTMASNILSILTRLESASGRLEKEAILKQNSDNKILKDVFRLALDPTINFYIKKVPEPILSSNVNTLEQGLSMLETHLASRKFRGHEAARHLAYTLGGLEAADQEVIKRVIGRSLKCGVSEGTVEKVWQCCKDHQQKAEPKLAGTYSHSRCCSDDQTDEREMVRAHLCLAKRVADWLHRSLNRASKLAVEHGG